MPDRKKLIVCALFASVVAAASVSADSVTTAITVGTNPVAIAVNPVTNRTYVANYGSGTVTVIDAANLTSTITVGSSPRAIAVNSLTNTIYVANFAGSSVSVIDGATNTVTTTVSVQSNPNAIAVNPATNMIYVTNLGNRTVTKINGSSNATSTIPVGVGPIAVCVNPVTNKIYVANSGSDNVTVINGATNDTAIVTAGISPSSIAANTVTNKIYVANNGSNNVTVIDGATKGTTTIGAGTNPSAVAVNLVTDTIYVVNSGSNNVTIIDGATGTASSVTVGTNPVALAINATSNKIYVANYGSNSISVITGAGVTATLTTGTNPNAVAVNPITNKIYTANSGSGNVTVIDGATNQHLTLNISGYGRNVDVNPVTNRSYILYSSGTNGFDAYVAVIDGATNLQIANVFVFSVSGLPGVLHFITSYAIAVNPVTNKIRVMLNYEYSYLTSPPQYTFGTVSGDIDGATNQIGGWNNTPIPSLNRTANENPVTNKIYTAGYVVNPVSNKIATTGGIIDETPSFDTKLDVFFDSLPYTGFYNTTFLAQPTITGKAVNRLRSGHTGISSVLISKTTAQSLWNHASIISGTDTDSVSWTWVWGSDTLLFGENLLCAVALDSQTTSTNNSGLGTPFTGNVTVYPIYRLTPSPASAPVLISPPDNSINQPLSLTFSWNAVANATYYRLQVSSDPLFSSFIYNNASVSGTSTTVSGLAYNTTYYWRVNAGNYSGISVWSAVWRFSTIVVDAPVLTSPANGTDVNIAATAPSLFWNTVANATSYSVQVSTDSNFSSTVINASNIMATNYQATSLSINTVYYWRVNASNGAGTGPWSLKWSFTTVSNPPSAPVLSSPISDAVNIITTPVLLWSTVASATSYSLQVSTDSNFSTTIVNQSNITSTNYQATGLSINTVYYWRVDASNGAGTGPWSLKWGFTTVSTPPATPVLSSPLNGTLSVLVNPTLSWNAITGASSYTVQVSIDSNFSSPIVNDSGITSTSHTAASLSAYTFYYWRVKAVNAVGPSAWSLVWNFMTGPAAPATPALVSPASGAINQPLSFSLVWNKSSTATSYYFQVATDTGFASIFTQDSSLTDSLKVISGLANSTAYYWRVRAKNAGGTSNWTGRWSFTTIIAAAATPMLVSPASGAINQPLSLSLVWNKVGTATSYYFQVATDSMFSNIFKQDSTITDTLKSDSGFALGTLYYWRLRAKNAGGSSAWSGVRNFTTIATGVLPYTPSIPRAFSVSNFSHLVRYTLPKTSHVSVRYFNLKGRLVASLVNSVQGPGYYTLPLGRDLFSSGTFIQVFEAGTFVKKNLIAIVR